jgi:DNA modification methylase
MTDWYLDDKHLLINDDFFNPFWHDILQNIKIDCIITDPPFNIADKGKVTKSHGKIYSNKEAWGSIFKDTFTPEEYDNFIIAYLSRCYLFLKPGGAFITFIDKKYAGKLIDFAEKIGFIYKNIITFVKKNCVPKIRAYNYASAAQCVVWLHKPQIKGTKTKPATFNYRKPKKGLRHPDGKLDIEKYHNTFSSNVFIYHTSNKIFDHPCFKYPGQVNPLIETHTNPGDTILDPFAGSFAIGWYAYILRRKYIGFDLDIKQFETIKRYFGQPS